MNNVKNLPNPVNYSPVAAELFDRIKNLVHEYDGEIGLVEAIGAIELVKLSVIEDAKE